MTSVQLRVETLHWWTLLELESTDDTGPGWPTLASPPLNDLTIGYQPSDSASSSKFHYLAWLAFLVLLVLLYSDSADLNFAIL